mmetsp:Transcript_8056/g.25123  ORF Transcript_8056/g.25123 Transcript_8056/m.25123 type:complete len:598 (-) Transcript_8056:676-2469(-)
MLAKLNGGSVSLEAWPEFELYCDGPNTEEEPFLLEEIGVDFFLRVQLKTRKVIWFESPAGEVFHSAAKPGGAGGRAKPGKRYCHICHKCFSANNFQTQHLANLHRPGAPKDVTCVPDGMGGVHLWWKAPTPPPSGEPELTAYQLRFSIDGGSSWQVGIDNTDSPEPCARVGNLSPGHAYLFMVAGINAAGMGEFSPPSAPLHHAPDGVNTNVRSLNSSISSPTSSVLSSPRSLYSGHDSPLPEGAAEVPMLPPSVMPSDLSFRGTQSGLALAPAPASDVVDAFVETMAAEAMSIGDDDLAATLQNLLDNTLESPRIDAIRRRRQDSLDESSLAASAKRCRVEAPAPPPTKRSSFSFDLEAVDLEMLLGDALPDVHAGPLYRSVRAIPTVIKRVSTEGRLSFKGADNDAAKERLKGALSRSAAKGSAAKLLAPETIYKLKARGFSRTASRLLTLAARNSPASAPKLFSSAGLPKDETTRSLQQEAAFLAGSAPAPRPIAATTPTLKLFDLPSPRSKRLPSILAVVTMAAVLISTLICDPTAVAAAYTPVALFAPSPPPVECGFRFFNCVAINADAVPGSSCQLAFSPLPTCRPKLAIS